jgi:hypothetical protein
MARPPQLIATSGPQVPHERISAYGFAPVTLVPKMSVPCQLRAGLCAAAQGWAEALLSDESRFAAAVLTTRCDQLRRTVETLRTRTRLPIFLMNVPVTRGTDAARRLHRDEQERLDGFLRSLGGAGASELRCITPAGRAVFPQTAAGACGEASLPDLARRFPDRPQAAEAADSVFCGGFRVGLLACLLTEADDAVVRMLRQVGLQIVAHATESPLGDTEKRLTASLQTEKRLTASLQTEKRLTASLQTKAPLLSSGCLLEPPPSIAQRPNAPFFAWLRQMGRAAGLDGWVLLRQPWCDLFHAEVARLKPETGLPWLDLETGACPALAALRTRAEAFAEMLQDCRGGPRLPTEGTRA